MSTSPTTTFNAGDPAESGPLRRHHMAPAYVRGIPSCVWQSAMTPRRNRTASAIT